MTPNTFEEACTCREETTEPEQTDEQTFERPSISTGYTVYEDRTIGNITAPHEWDRGSEEYTGSKAKDQAEGLKGNTGKAGKKASSRTETDDRCGCGSKGKRGSNG